MNYFILLILLNVFFLTEGHTQDDSFEKIRKRMSNIRPGSAPTNVSPYRLVHSTPVIHSKKLIDSSTGTDISEEIEVRIPFIAPLSPVSVKDATTESRIETKSIGVETNRIEIKNKNIEAIAVMKNSFTETDSLRHQDQEINTDFDPLFVKKVSFDKTTNTPLFEEPALVPAPGKPREFLVYDSFEETEDAKDFPSSPIIKPEKKDD